MTITASYDLFVPVRERVRLDAISLTAALAELGLSVELPGAARFGGEYVPVRVTLPNAVIRTGCTLVPPESFEQRIDSAEATIEGEIASFSVIAFNAPRPRDENELPLAFFVAAAIAKLGRGAVFDPQEDDAPLDDTPLKKRLRKYKRAFEPKESGWDEYPYELFLALDERNESGAQREIAALQNVDTPDAHGNTPLMLALRKKLSALAQEVLRRGANPNAVNRYGSAPLDEALKAEDVASLRLLLEHGADGGQAALRMAATGTRGALERLLDAGIPIDTKTPGGWTLLMLAKYEGHDELASWLTERGARAEDPL